MTMMIMKNKMFVATAAAAAAAAGGGGMTYYKLVGRCFPETYTAMLTSTDTLQCRLAKLCPFVARTAWV